MELTEKWLTEHALPDGVDRELWWDERVVGFGVRIGRRHRTFLVWRRVGRGMKQIAIGHHNGRDAEGQRWTLIRARRQAEIMLGAMKAGADPTPARRATIDAGGPTLAAALELHVANMRKRGGKGGGPCSERSIEMIDGEIRRLLPEWLGRPILELTADALDEVCKRIAPDEPDPDRPQITGAVNGRGKALANRLIAQVSAVWNTADRRYDLPGKNPARRLTSHHLAPREERIPDGEFADWYKRVQTLAPIRRDLQLLLLFTGARSESARFAPWDDVDWKRSVLHFRRAKGNRPYTVPLPTSIADMLKRRRDDNAIEMKEFGGDAGLIFPSWSRTKPFRVIPMGEPKEWRLDDAGEREKFLPGPHPLRRTYNSVAIEVGIAERDLKRLMNHEGQGVNARHYAFPEDWSHLARAQAKIERALWQRIKAR